MRFLPWKKKKGDEDALHPNKPIDSPFTQQNLSAFRLEVSVSTMLPVLLCFTISCIPIGIVFLTVNSKVLEKVVEYTNCKQYECGSSYNPASGTKKYCCKVTFQLPDEFKGQVFMYYKLDNFFQNHRMYARSKDDEQFYGIVKTTLAPTCKEPFRHKKENYKNNSWSIPVTPCGAVANSLFNDTFKMVYIQLGPDLEVTMSQKDITWSSEKSHKFRNPSLKNVQNGTLSSALRGFGAPINWQNPVYQLSPYEPEENGFLNSDLIEWMRTAAFPSFRKLHRRIIHVGAHFEKGLPKGNYRMDIKYNYPVKDFKGKKYFVLTTASWLGGKNSFLGVCYLTIGIISFISSFLATVMHMKSRTRTQKVGSIDNGIELRAK
ncbi:cell cycle control protein 50C-like isoform X2 [Rhopilema esculentum]|uniref:cell cycle control protein 50C-like isoform X2 n=1 Tax=Rhopilema esculentum TaxID=499914 RepID=UPI0031DA9B13